MSELELNPDYGDLMLIQKFERAIRSGLFTNYDGFGYFATSTHHDPSQVVVPSIFKKLMMLLLKIFTISMKQ